MPKSKSSITNKKPFGAVKDWSRHKPTSILDDLGIVIKGDVNKNKSLKGLRYDKKK